MSNSISIISNRIEGYTKATKFSFSIDHPSVNNLKFVKWILGDGSIFYDIKSLDYYYQLPGTYNIGLYAYNNTTLLSAIETVTVENFLKESIYFDTIPPPTFAGHYNRYPFRIHITSSTTQEHSVDLYSQFSRSYPYQEPQNKWSFLRPQWRFLDLEGNQIWNLKTKDAEIKIDDKGELNSNGITVGVSGFADFYFIDDIYNHDLALDDKTYTTIWATLQTSAIRADIEENNLSLQLPSYSNSTATAFSPYVFLRRVPDVLYITENGIRNYINPRWTLAENPINIKTGFYDTYPDDWIEGSGVTEYKREENFAKYVPLLTSGNIPISVGLTYLSANFVPTPQFQWKDDTTYQVAGYYKGAFALTANDAFTTTVTAAAYITTPPTSSIYYNPLIWLSNPQAGTFTVAQYYNNTTSTFLQVSTPNLNVAHVKTFEMPIIQNVDFTMDPMALSGFHGIYSIAALPAPTYHAWVSDSELDKIYRINSLGDILCSIDLKKVLEDNSLNYLVEKKISPAQITLDGHKNMWVSLYDTVSVLKFNSAGNFLFATSLHDSYYTIVSLSSEEIPIVSLSSDEIKFKTIQSIIPNYPKKTNRQWYLETSYYDGSIDGNYDYSLVEPTGIETDKDNNVWVSYSNPLRGHIVKFGEYGELMQTIAAPLCSTPQEMVTDKDGNLWICYAGIVWNALGSIEKRTSPGTLIRAITGIRNPNYLTLDINQNLWFSWGFNKIGTINTNTFSTVTYTISGVDLKPNDYPKKNRRFDSRESTDPWFDESKNADESAIEGIACDMRGYLYVINSIENQIYVFDTRTRKIVGRFYVNPQGFLFYQRDQEEPTLMAYYLWNKSLQAAGDWTGWKWVNKFGINYLPYYTNTTTNFYISGESVPLNFYEKSVYDAFKVNETFDLAANMYENAQMPILKNSENLFNSFLGSIFGKSPFSHDDLGVVSYEKISNYVLNNSDPDTCEITQLYNMSNMVDYNSDNFQLNYPETIKRLLNLASVNISNLIGTKCNCDSNLNLKNEYATSKTCSYCKKQKIDNIGEELNTLTYQVTAGIPVVLKINSLNNYRLIPTGNLNNSNVYSLDILASSLRLSPDWKDFYSFYEFLNLLNNNIIENLIDWEFPQTTISRNLSTSQDWFKNEGILDILFNYELYKGLELLR